MVFLLLVSVLFSRTPYLLLIDGRHCWAGEKFKWRQLAHHQLMSQQGLILVHTEKLKPKGPISEKLVSHIALASVLLGENPSEEVDDYDNYYYYYYEFIARNDGFWRAPEIDFRYETKARKVVVDS